MSKLAVNSIFIYLQRIFHTILADNFNLAYFDIISDHSLGIKWFKVVYKLFASFGS